MIKGLVSVVIPTYNGEKFLEECLLSISKQIYPHEIIIIDDKSNDRTIEIASKYNAKIIINDAHKGQVAGKNTGIKNMSGEYFVTIDQDDKFKEGALSKLVDELEKNKAQIVMSKLEDFADSEKDKKYCHKEPFRGILTGASIFRKEVFDIIGYFDESIITGDVIDLVDRCNKNNVSIYKSEIVTCDRRIHDQNYGRTNQKDEYKDYAKLLRKQFLERMKNGNSK